MIFGAWVLIRLMRVIEAAPRAQKNPPTFISRRKVPWRFLFRRSLLDIDPLGSRHLAVPTAGRRIRFPESLLMLIEILRDATRFVNERGILFRMAKITNQGSDSPKAAVAHCLELRKPKTIAFVNEMA